MQYFEKFNLGREPFSFTPDPEMFYRSQSRMDCLRQLIVAIRLHRGVSAVIGGVGLGKTTLCRVLVRELTHFKGIDVYLILNADFAGRREFLLHLARLLGIQEDELAGDPPALAERITACLLERYQTHNRIVCLLIDEGQVMAPECFGALEELSAVEIQDGKLLQTVIFGQNEFLSLLPAHPALAQRINYLHVLQPFSFWETRAMVEARLGVASVAGRPRPRFTWPALVYLHRKSGGYPRKIVRLCHRALIGIPIGGKTIRLQHVKHSAQTQLVPAKPGKASAARMAVAAAAILAAAWAAYAVFTSRPWQEKISGTASPVASVAPNPLPPSEIRVRVAEQTPPGAPPAAGREAAEKAEAPLRETNGLQTEVETAAPAAGHGEIRDRDQSVDQAEPPLQVAQAQQAAGEASPKDVAPQRAGTETAVCAQDESRPRDEGVKADEPPARVGETGHPEPEPVTPVTPVTPMTPMTRAEADKPAPAMATPPETTEPSAQGPRVDQTEIPAQAHGTAARLNEAGADTATPITATPVTAVAAETAQPPALLGQVKLKTGWSFAKRQEDVYGRRDKAVFDAMAKANPGLASIFDAGPGAVVNFPAVTAPAPPPGVALLSLMRAENLDQALDYIVSRSTPHMPLKLFATFSPAGGTRLDVILLPAFPGPRQAGEAKSALPAELAAQASVLTGFSRDTVFYSLLPPGSIPAAPAGGGQADVQTEQTKQPGQTGQTGQIGQTRQSPPAEAPAPQAPVPAMLGNVPLKPGWALWRCIEDLYGRRDKDIFGAMVKANPGLESVTGARPGNPINYPAVPAPPPPAGTAYVAVARADSLAAAFEYLVAGGGGEKWPLRIFATQLPGRPPLFYLILARNFPSAEQAQKFLAALPPELAGQATVLSGFEAGTVFYSSASAPPVRPAAPTTPAASAAPTTSAQPARHSPDRSPKPYAP